MNFLKIMKNRETDSKSKVRHPGQVLQQEVLLFLQRKRRHGRSLTDSELKQILQMGGFEKEESMSSEALLSSSACPSASLSIEGEKDAKIYEIKEVWK